MQDEDIFFWQNELGKTFIELNRLEKSGFRKKKLVMLFETTRYMAFEIQNHD